MSRAWCAGSGKKVAEGWLHGRTRCPDCTRRVQVAGGRLTKHRLPASEVAGVEK